MFSLSITRTLKTPEAFPRTKRLLTEVLFKRRFNRLVTLLALFAFVSDATLKRVELAL